MGMNAPSGLYYMFDFHTVIYYNDAHAPMDVLQLMQYPGYKRTHAVNQHSRYFPAAILNEAYRSGGSTSYSIQYKQWMDFAATDVPHFGLKYCLDPGNPAGGAQIALLRYVTFHFDPVVRPPRRWSNKS